MGNIEKSLEEITEIRAMMERASKFISLSGMSGISAGIVALGGAFIAHWILGGGGGEMFPHQTFSLGVALVILAIAVLLLAVGFSTLFTARMARRLGVPLWDETAKSLVLALVVPLAAGGGMCLVLLSHFLFSLLPSMMLVFYGLALVSAGKYTLGEVRYLGIVEVGIGLAAGLWPEWGLVLWGIGFGVLHIVYGIAMYMKYEK